MRLNPREVVQISQPTTEGLVCMTAVGKEQKKLEAEARAYELLRQCPEYRGIVADTYVATPTASVFPLNELANLQTALAAVRRLHAAGIIHGDLKNDHVLIDTRSRVFFVDFGDSQTRLLAPSGAYTPLFTSLDALVLGNVHPLDDYEALLMAAVVSAAPQLLPPPPFRDNRAQTRKGWLRWKVAFMHNTFSWHTQFRAQRPVPIHRVIVLGLLRVWTLPRNSSWLSDDDHASIVRPSMFEENALREQLWTVFETQLTRTIRQNGRAERVGLALGAPRASRTADEEKAAHTEELQEKMLLERFPAFSGIYRDVSLWDDEKQQGRELDAEFDTLLFRPAEWFLHPAVTRLTNEWWRKAHATEELQVYPSLEGVPGKFICGEASNGAKTIDALRIHRVLLRPFQLLLLVDKLAVECLSFSPSSLEQQIQVMQERKSLTMITLLVSGRMEVKAVNPLQTSASFKLSTEQRALDAEALAGVQAALSKEQEEKKAAQAALAKEQEEKHAAQAAEKAAQAAEKAAQAALAKEQEEKHALLQRIKELEDKNRATS